jgi:aryl-alcohol dehydrogenase-like predicted oxidoreductase
VGVSNYGPKLLTRALARLGERGVPLASNQINYSLLYRKQGAQATVDFCQQRGITVLGYFPLANGLLAGDTQPPAPLHTEQCRSPDFCAFPRVTVHSPVTLLIYLQQCRFLAPLQISRSTPTARLHVLFFI